MIRVCGDYYQLEHLTKKGLVTIQHPKKNLYPKVIKSILKYAELEKEVLIMDKYIFLTVFETDEKHAYCAIFKNLTGIVTSG